MNRIIQAPVHVENLAVDRGDRRVLSGLGFEIAAGEIVHLTGRNGAGKTSLLEILAGLRTPSAGRIEGQPAAEARHWLGHRNGLTPALSPAENLHYWAGLEGLALADETIIEALRRVDLYAQRYRPIGQLSTGQKRRAALARLVAAPRPWWLLDEPLAGLDAGGLAIFAELLAAHAAAQGSALVTSHQPLPGAVGARSLALAA